MNHLLQGRRRLLLRLLGPFAHFCPAKWRQMHRRRCRHGSAQSRSDFGNFSAKTGCAGILPGEGGAGGERPVDGGANDGGADEMLRSGGKESGGKMEICRLKYPLGDNSKKILFGWLSIKEKFNFLKIFIGNCRP